MPKPLPTTKHGERSDRKNTVNEDAENTCIHVTGNTYTQGGDMKVWQRLTICTALVLLALGPACNALAASVSGRSSTEIEWFDDAQGDTALPVFV